MRESLQREYFQSRTQSLEIQSKERLISSWCKLSPFSKRSRASSGWKALEYRDFHLPLCYNPFKMYSCEPD